MEGQSRKELMTILLFCMYRVDFILMPDYKKLQSIYKVCYVLLFKSHYLIGHTTHLSIQCSKIYFHIINIV